MQPPRSGGSSPLEPPDPAALTGFAAYLFDADGTLWHGLRAIDGAAEVVAELKRRGRCVGVVSNNSRLAVATLHERMRVLGIPVEPDEIMSAPLAAALYIAQELPGAHVFALGSDELREQLVEQGLHLAAEPGRVEYLVIGLDQEITYAKLAQALLIVRAGARIVALNTDRVSVDEHGLYPGAGMIVGAVRGMTGRDPDVVIGKPSPLLLEEAALRLGVEPAATLFVGDYLETDILAANRAGMPSLLVLTGVSQPPDLERSQARPDYILPGVADLYRLISES